MLASLPEVDHRFAEEDVQVDIRCWTEGLPRLLNCQKSGAFAEPSCNWSGPTALRSSIVGEP